MYGTMLVLVALATAPEAKSTPAAKPAVTKSAVTKSAAAKTAAAKPASELHAIENRILEETNRARRRHGLRPLRLDFGLLRSARRHASWMTRNHSLQHTSAPVAENIAMGQSTAPEVLNDWMNSPGHRANILNASYTRIGVSAYRSRGGTVFWCQQFN